MFRLDVLLVLSFVCITSAFPQADLQNLNSRDSAGQKAEENTEESEAVDTIPASNQPCEDKLCNDQGTCIGTVETHMCFCKIGFTGTHCEEGPCDSATDCSGKGMCIGTSNSYTCLCQLGYSGEHCENGTS